MEKKNDHRKSTWAIRWRDGSYRRLLAHFKYHGKPSEEHPKVDGMFDFRGATFKNQSLRKANFSNCICDEIDLTRIKIKCSNFENSVFENAFLEGARLPDSNFSNTTLLNCRLEHAYLYRANFSNSTLTGAVFHQANLKELNLSGSKLFRTSFKNAKNLNTIVGIPSDYDELSFLYDDYEQLLKTEFGTDLCNNTQKFNVNRKYNIAISFAGEDRKFASELAKLLEEGGYKVFYDKYEQADLWGRNLCDHLENVYQNNARYCVMFLSQHYLKKPWARLERQSARDREFFENNEYILPIRLDDTKIPGILNTTGYLDARTLSIREIFELVKEKLSL